MLFTLPESGLLPPGNPLDVTDGSGLSNFGLASLESTSSSSTYHSSASTVIRTTPMLDILADQQANNDHLSKLTQLERELSLLSSECKDLHEKLEAKEQEIAQKV